MGWCFSPWLWAIGISKNAIKMMAQCEGLILDPVYTAKSLRQFRHWFDQA